ncbi:MAG TPA: hypothetical protein VHG89_00155 [Verrucomicrobiae bacterium]|nr:hypothetical protein [Verrucomicrobiae bacterium]
MKREDLEKLKAYIQSGYEADIAAVNQLLSRFDENRQARVEQLAAWTAMNRPRRTVSDIVEDLIRKTQKNFRIYDILRKLQTETGKEPTPIRGRIVGQVINKLRQRNPPEIEEIEKGRGSRSGVYRYKPMKIS